MRHGHVRLAPLEVPPGACAAGPPPPLRGRAGVGGIAVGGWRPPRHSAVEGNALQLFGGGAVVTAFAAGAAPALSPSASSVAIGVLTLTPSVPSETSSLPTLPSSTASTSIVALSVSISAMMSPALTVWPSLTSHLASLPSSMVGESAGIRISVGMSVSLPDKSQFRRRPFLLAPGDARFGRLALVHHGLGGAPLELREGEAAHIDRPTRSCRHPPGSRRHTSRIVRTAASCPCASRTGISSAPRARSRRSRSPPGRTPSSPHAACRTPHWHARACSSAAGFDATSVARIAPQWQVP